MPLRDDPVRGIYAELSDCMSRVSIIVTIALSTVSVYSLHRGLAFE